MATESPGKKALTYAEVELGVNKVYEDAIKSRNKLDETLTELSKVRDRKRDLEYRLKDAEMEVASDERGKHPEMSATAMEKHLKIALSNTDEIRELREQLSKVTGDIEGLEYDKDIIEVDIRIAIARLTELGGYLQYLAVAKQLSAIPRSS